MVGQPDARDVAPAPPTAPCPPAHRATIAHLDRPDVRDVAPAPPCPPAHHGTTQPHAVLFPFPAQGHINPMMHLAAKLLSHGFFVSFINTDYIHHRMFPDDDHHHAPNLRFLHLPDGLPPTHGRFNESLDDTVAAIEALPGPLAKLIHSKAREPLPPPATEHGHGVGIVITPPPITCIISDAVCSWMQDVADQLGVARVSLCTAAAHANLAYHFQSRLIDQGYLPLTDLTAASDIIISCIPGIVPMKLQDYISFFLWGKPTDFILQWLLRICMHPRSDEATWNLGNTWAELDMAATAAFTAEVPNYLSIGPILPDLILSTLMPSPGNCTKNVLQLPEFSFSMWAEDSSCLDWLALHPPASVLYVAFGSILQLPAEELESLIQGIRESGVPFLWAVRPDQPGGAALEALRAELEDSSSSSAAEAAVCSGRIVAWAPQLAVLAHPSVGGFLSHCGWNSLLESLSLGVPLLARAGGFAEQRMNAHYVSEVWKVGLRVHEGAGAREVAELVREVMKEGGEVRRRAEEARRSAISAAATSGSSAGNYALFVDDMRRRAAAAAASSNEEPANALMSKQG